MRVKNASNFKRAKDTGLGSLLIFHFISTEFQAAPKSFTPSLLINYQFHQKL